MESKAGSILTLIGAIITFLAAGFFLIVGVTALFSSAEDRAAEVIIGIVFIVIAIGLLIIALIKLRAAKYMKLPETTKKGGIMAIITGILAPELVSLIGGILGVFAAGNPNIVKPGTAKPAVAAAKPAPV